MGLHVAIDFDGTYSEAPECFGRLIEMFQVDGHRCFVITGRDKKRSAYVEDQVLSTSPLEESDIYFAPYGNKREVARKNNLDIDVWIDDNPASVLGLSGD